MDIDAINLKETNIRYTKLSPDQMESYKREGKCFSCGTKGHMSRQCPNKKSNYKGKRPQNGNWKKGGKGSSLRNIRSVKVDDEKAEEEKQEESPEEDDIARIRAMLADLSTEERDEIFREDFQ